jgi:hypothetical protein
VGHDLKLKLGADGKLEIVDHAYEGRPDRLFGGVSVCTSIYRNSRDVPVHIVLYLDPVSKRLYSIHAPDSEFLKIGAQLEREQEDEQRQSPRTAE